MKIKYLNIFWLIIPMLFLQPSFACGCGEEYGSSGISGIIVLALIVFSFFVPLIYALAKFRAYRLSAKILLAPYILSFAIIGGLYLLVDQYGNRIPLPMTHKSVSINTIAMISCIFVLLLWLAPAIYTYRKGKLIQ